MVELQKHDLKTDKRPYDFKKRSCPLSIAGAPKVDYKNIKLLKKFISEKGKMLPSRITSVSTKKQRELSKAIKRARFLALLPYVNN
jgi:small subunit ribosomal protein S18|tara:strand:+ start:201 stop:458 length:258 start_codon:yes stop_codon:yes gene_type:complete